MEKIRELNHRQAPLIAGTRCDSLARSLKGHGLKLRSGLDWMSGPEMMLWDDKAAGVIGAHAAVVGTRSRVWCLWGKPGG